MRTIVDIPDDQLEALRRLCERENISRAEAIRRAVAAFIEVQRDRARARDAALVASFGLWKPHGIDTDTYLEQVRSEWER